MAYDARVIEVMVASPSDVADERRIVREVISEWNAVHSRERRAVLMATGWETHSSPELSGRPQQLINERVLAHSDLLVGIFWTRVGSPTGKAISGSVEEIEEHLGAGKPVMLYFSEAPVKADSVDDGQYKQLKAFKAWAIDRGLVATYENVAAFRSAFSRDLQMALRDNQYLRDNLRANEPPVAGDFRPREPALSPEAFELLKAGADDPQGYVLMHRTYDGLNIGNKKRSFGEPGNRREMAKWEAALEELEERGYLRDNTGKRVMFEVTASGYHAAGK